MEDTTLMDAVPRQDEDYKAAIDRFIVGIEKNRAEMSESDARIEQVRAETSKLMAQTRQILARLAE